MKSAPKHPLSHAKAHIEALERAVRRVLDNGWLDDAPNNVVQELRTALREAEKEPEWRLNTSDPDSETLREAEDG